MADNRTCVICGKSYSYCPVCGSDKGKPAWYSLFDSENCKNIYGICVDYRDGNMSKKDAADALAKCDLSEVETFESGTRENIRKITDGRVGAEVVEVSEIPEVKEVEEVVVAEVKETVKPTANKFQKRR